VIKGLLLTVVAAVISVEGDVAVIDRGLLDGLLRGDRGSSYYELEVGEASHRVVGGSVVLDDVGSTSAKFSIPSGITVRPGSFVEFQVGADRIAPSALVAAVRTSIENEEERRTTIQRILNDFVPAKDEDLRAELRQILESGATESPELAADELPPAAAQRPDRADSHELPTVDPLAGMQRISSGSYQIGRDSRQARYFNEQPRFVVMTNPFWIDREPVYPESGLQFSFDQAQAHCRDRGKGLPTEFEWEIAIQEPGVKLDAAIYEWTASWYQPYPGNTYAEEEYGKSYRVLRGDSGPEDLRPFRRRFMAPAPGHRRVGFRCVRDESAASP
jgi:hypothetical protein